MPAQQVQYMPVEGATMAPNTIAGAQVWHVGADGTATRLAWGGESSHYISDVHDGVIFTTELGAATHVGISVSGGPLTPFITPADGSDAFELRTDGANLVWRQGYERTGATQYTRVEIWTAPYTTDGAALVGRRVGDAGFAAAHHDVDFYGNAVVDLAPTFVGDFSRYVVHFLDGSPSRVITAPPDRIMEVLYAGPDEVGMLVEYLNARVETVRFFRYDALPLAE